MGLPVKSNILTSIGAGAAVKSAMTIRRGSEGGVWGDEAPSGVEGHVNLLFSKILGTRSTPGKGGGGRPSHCAPLHLWFLL